MVHEVNQVQGQFWRLSQKRGAAWETVFEAWGQELHGVSQSGDTIPLPPCLLLLRQERIKVRWCSQVLRAVPDPQEAFGKGELRLSLVSLHSPSSAPVYSSPLELCPFPQSNTQSLLQARTFASYSNFSQNKGRALPGEDVMGCTHRALGNIILLWRMLPCSASSRGCWGESLIGAGVSLTPLKLSLVPFCPKWRT